MIAAPERGSLESTVPAEIQLRKREDWQALRKGGLTTVLDPMVFRAGELFLGRRSDTYLPAGEAWQSLRANISYLAAFFDALVFNLKLPVFDYQVTFREGPELGSGMSRQLVPAVNAVVDVLTPVNVYDDASYLPFKAAALAELEARPPVSDADQQSIVREMERSGTSGHRI